MKKGIYFSIAVALPIFLVSFFLRWQALQQTSFANGWDSYFYIIQLKSLLTKGSMHSEEWTLLYPFLVIINFFSPDYITTVKILSAMLAGAFSVILYFTARSLQATLGVTLLITCYTFFSPELTYFAAQWPKNLLGVILLLALFISILHNKKRWIITLLLVSFFGHRMTAVLGIVLVLIWALQKHISFKIVLSFIAILVLALLAGMVLPGILHVGDISRLQNTISTRPQLPVNSFYELFGKEKVSTWWQAELWLTATCILALLITEIVRLTKTRKIETYPVMLLVIFLILWFPFYHWEISGAAYRLFHVGALLTPLLILFLVHDRASQRGVVFIAAGVLLVASFLSWKSYDPFQHDPPYAFYDSIAHHTRSAWKDTGTPELIIAHKALAEYLTYSTGKDAMPWIPEYAIDSVALWRVAVLPYPNLYSFHTGQSPRKLELGYYYIRETDWQRFLGKLRAEDPSLLDQHLTWKNPNEMRPGYLRRR